MYHSITNIVLVSNLVRMVGLGPIGQETKKKKEKEKKR
jgi:hypothetical protein